MSTETDYVEANTIPGFDPEKIYGTLSEGQYIVINQSHSDPLIAIGLIEDKQRLMVHYNDGINEKFGRITPAAVTDFMKSQPESPEAADDLNLRKYTALKALAQQLRNTAAPRTFYQNMEISFNELSTAQKPQIQSLKNNVSIFYKCFSESLTQIDFYAEIAVFLHRQYEQQIAGMRDKLYEIDYEPTTPEDKLVASAMAIYDFVSEQTRVNWHDEVPTANMMMTVSSRK